MAEFNIRNFKSWDELLLRAALELSPNDLLYIRKFGRSASLTANTTEDVWEQGGTLSRLTSAETLDIVSTSIADDLGSTGAQIVQVSGLDNDYNLITELVNMDGTTNATTTNSFLRVNRMLVAFSGTGQKNAGTITATSSSSATVQAKIPAGESITQQSHFTVPAGYTCFTLDVRLSAYRASGGSGTKAAEVDQMAYTPDSNTIYQSLRNGVTSTGGAFVSNPRIVAQAPAKTDLWYQATPETTGTVVTTSVGYLLIKEGLNFRTEV